MPIVALIVGGGVILGGIWGVWNLLSRRVPFLSDADLADPNCRVVRKLVKSDRQVLYKAFAQGHDFVWTYSGNKDPKQLTEQDAEPLATQASYMVDFVVELTEDYGHVITCVDETDGSYLGSICLLPPTSRSVHAAYMIHTAVARVGKPPSVVEDDADRKDRFRAWEQTVAYHHEVMDSYGDHWSVPNLGVAVTAQGKGVGRRLLQEAYRLTGDLPVYLECHDGNVPFYEKMGFVVKKSYLLQPKKENAGGLRYNSMVYDPKAAKT